METGLFIEVYLWLYVMSLFIFGVAVLSNMFSKKVKTIIDVNSASMRTGTLFTLVNAELF